MVFWGGGSMHFLDQEKQLENFSQSPITRIIERRAPNNAWVEINKAALEHNIMSYKAIVGQTLLAPVIKSNAYGHGIEHIAKICDQDDAIDIICVVSLSEALFLRSIGIRKPLLVLSILDGNLDEAIIHDIDLVVFDLTVAQELNRIGILLGKKARVHVKVDTGLSRLGLLKDDAITFVQTLSLLEFITIHGIFTHFAYSESDDQTFTDYQLANFKYVIQTLEAQGISIPLKHTSCSAAITANMNSHYNMARLGVGLYGLWPSPENRNITKTEFPRFSLKPVLSWKTRVMQVKEVPADSYVGYDCTHHVNQDSKIAILPVGYWDGYDRRLSNTGKVLVNNHVVPVVGRVAMNLMMIDVTGLNVKPGDEVTLLGNHTGLTADDIAKSCQTINYEIVTRINPILARVITE